MTEENRVTPADQRVAHQPQAPDSDHHVSAEANGRQTTGAAPVAEAHQKLRALALRLAVSAILFAVLALLSIGAMLLADVKPQTALGVGLLGSFLAVMAVQNFLPIYAAHPTDPSGKPSPNAAPSLGADLLLLLRWIAGLLIVLLCGWVCLGVTAYLFYNSTTENAFRLALLAASTLSLGAFYLLERDFWLSRFMGLHISPEASPLWSAVWLWLFGVAGLLLRSSHRPEAATSPEAKTKEAQQPTDSFREVIETVVFVVVLVLLLKSFVAEAFVIPTGSMAETLYGYQKVITCPKCKYVFPVNVSQEVDPSEGSPQKITGCTCPNCRHQIEFATEASANTDWGSGDRVLVGKYFYELVDLPERLEVVVFKYPGDDTWPHKGPHNNHIPLNYIKRLIGKPGETIAIYQGKLYVLSPELGPQYKDWELAQQDPEVMARLWQTKYQHVNEARDQFEDGKFTLVRKPPDTMLAMSRVVYDNDHPASDLKIPRWAAPGSSWVSGNANDFTNPGGSTAMEWLRYSHLLRKTNGKTLITDFTGYNTFETGIHPHPPAENWVGDLLLECEVTLDRPEGTLVLQLSKSHDRFEARWNLATGDCDLFRLHDGREPEKLGSAKTTLSTKGHTYRVRFANVDQKLTVWVDHALPFGEDGVAYSIPPTEATGPTEENDLEPASIGVQGGAVKVRKIKLSRDTYYTYEPGKSDFGDPKDKNNWQKMDHFRRDSVKTIYVQPHHYLCLGDNSPESSDGRSWGSVPERLLLGRAMLVYYPFGRAGKIR
jgi:signal peptidase I